MEEAEAILLHYVQRHLKNDVNKGAVDKKLSKLCPYIDEGGHVRVGVESLMSTPMPKVNSFCLREQCVI